jgi:hypothetical protein
MAAPTKPTVVVPPPVVWQASYYILLASCEYVYVLVSLAAEREFKVLYW